MNQIIYTKLDGNGNPMPKDAQGHVAVKVEHPLLAQPLFVSARRVSDSENWKDAAAACEKFDACGWPWRLPTVEEAFLISDRSQWPSLPKEFFPDATGYEFTWTSTPDAEDPAGCAWGVRLAAGLPAGFARRVTSTSARCAPVSSLLFDFNTRRRV